jgi:hypothetical protein
MKLDIKNCSVQELAFGLNNLANLDPDGIYNPYRAGIVAELMPVIGDWSALRKPLQSFGADVSFRKNQDPVIVGSQAQRLSLSESIRTGLKRGPKVSTHTRAAERLVEFVEQYRADNAPADNKE